MRSDRRHPVLLLVALAAAALLAPAAATAQSGWNAAIDKQVVTNGCRAAGSVVEFSIVIQNTGSRPLRNSVFSDVLDPAFTAVSVDGGLSYDAATNTIYTSPSTYGVGQESGYTYRATLPCTPSGTLSNTGTFTFEDNQGNVYTRSDTETVWWGLPDMTDSSKTWSDDPADGDAIVMPGEKVTFTIVIRNNGTCRALDVTVLDDLDLRFMSSAPALSISDGGVYDAATGQVRWDQTTTPQLASVPVGGSVTLSFTTEVVAGTFEGGFIPNTVVIEPLGGETFCSNLPSMARTITLQNGDVAYGVIAPDRILLRNDQISCLADAFATIAGDAPGSVPMLLQRTAPQECSNLPAINEAHPQTDVFVNPVSPRVFPADAVLTVERCPQPAAGGGRLLIFYELKDDCTTTLRVVRDPSNPWGIIVIW